MATDSKKSDISKNTHFPTSEEIEAIGKFVKRRQDKDNTLLAYTARQWTRTAWENKLDWEVLWFGVPIIQNPYDMVLMQELIFRVRPDTIVETGVAHGGSLIYYASLLQLLGRGKVIGVDIKIDAHNRDIIETHPLGRQITLFEGNSVDPSILGRIKKIIRPRERVLVCFDSDHHGDHVYAELNSYKNLVSKGSYMVVFDTHIPVLRGLRGLRKDYTDNSPMEAVQKFLKKNPRFSHDPYFEKFFVSSCPGGFLKKIA